MEILSDHEVAAEEACAGALAAAGPVAEKMIADGEIVLKNKEERQVFSDFSLYSKETSGLCSRYCALEKECREIQEAIISHPVPLAYRGTCP